jgi:hypothetical protein
MGWATFWVTFSQTHLVTLAPTMSAASLVFSRAAKYQENGIGNTLR